MIERATIPAVSPGRWMAAAGLLAGLAGVVGARWAATRLGLDPLGVGAAFGLALGAVWLAAGARAAVGGRPGRYAVALAAGLGVGLILVAIALAGSWLGGLQLVPGAGRAAAPFAAWAAVTVLVAATEEGILRGVLFDSIRGAGGTALALVITTLSFALIHVPLYGWEVVPLDLAVGLALGGLRLSTGTVLAPAAAHAVADLATWWP